MKSKIIFLLALLVFASLIFLTLPIFAQYQEYQYTESESMTCGNGICEDMRFQLKKGEEKAVEIAGKTYNFKFLEIITTESEGKIVSYRAVITVNGEEMTGMQTKEKYGFIFHPVGVREDFTYVKVRENEVEGCAVPDCRFRIELDLYKKWNLVPVYLLGELLSETELQKGTCELRDFLVIYGYDPIKKDYVKLHSYGKSVYDLKSSVTDFGRIGEDEKIFVGMPFNSVWVYSLDECRLVTELPKGYGNLLLLIEYLKGQGMIHNFAPGWNFWTGSPDMEGKNFDEIKGSCLIEKAYTFDASSQSWKKLETPPGPETNFLFKVKNSCMFGFQETSPPGLPE